jgi:hypothetical protein
MRANRLLDLVGLGLPEAAHENRLTASRSLQNAELAEAALSDPATVR